MIDRSIVLLSLPDDDYKHIYDSRPHLFPQKPAASLPPARL